MLSSFQDARCAIALLLRDRATYPLAAFQQCLRAALQQQPPAAQVIVVDERGRAARADFLPPDADAQRVRHVPGTYASRAAMCNAALAAAEAEFLLLVLSDAAEVRLRGSAAHTMLMAATRQGPAGVSAGHPHAPGSAARRPVGLVYADYERVAADGGRREVHLLDWHAGRLRDTFDIGSALLLNIAALREVGGFNEQFMAADIYDLRLRLSERYGVAHIANRYAGSLYSVSAAGAGHNVFDYLLASRESQLEMERACTEHLQRTGAYLAPGAHARPVQNATPAGVRGEEVRGAGVRSEPRPSGKGAEVPGEGVRGSCRAAPQAGDSSDCIASVVTPVNNRPEFIGRAIESVQAQTLRQVEMIVVVNGGEDDPTCAAVRRYMEGGDKYDSAKPPVRLMVVDVNNLGLCLNSGIAAARGQYYVQLDSDDRLKPDAVEQLIAVFESDKTIGMVVGSYEVWTLQPDGSLRRNEEVPVVTHPEWTADNGRNNLLRINGAGAPRAAHVQAIAEAGWFGVNDTPHSRNYGEDYDLVLRISERHTIGRVWEPIYEVIRHSGGTDHAIDQATIDRNDNAKDQMRLEALERRRGLNGRKEALQW